MDKMGWRWIFTERFFSQFPDFKVKSRKNHPINPLLICIVHNFLCIEKYWRPFFEQILEGRLISHWRNQIFQLLEKILSTFSVQLCAWKIESIEIEIMIAMMVEAYPQLHLQMAFRAAQLHQSLFRLLHTTLVWFSVSMCNITKCCFLKEQHFESIIRPNLKQQPI